MSYQRFKNQPSPCCNECAMFASNYIDEIGVNGLITGKVETCLHAHVCQHILRLVSSSEAVRDLNRTVEIMMANGR